jgi:hypothetical protein
MELSLDQQILDASFAADAGAILQLFDIKANINACDANLYTDDIEGNVD